MKAAFYTKVHRTRARVLYMVHGVECFLDFCFEMLSNHENYLIIALRTYISCVSIGFFVFRGRNKATIAVSKYIVL